MVCNLNEIGGFEIDEIKFILFSIASIVLIQSFNIHIMDVLKLKNLIEHIEFHKSTYGDDVFDLVLIQI